MNNRNPKSGWNRIKLSDWCEEGLKNLEKTAEMRRNPNGSIYKTPSGRYAFWRDRDLESSPIRITAKPVAKIAKAEPRPIRPQRKINRVARVFAFAVVMLMLLGFLGITIQGIRDYIKSQDTGAYYWPIVPPNEVYASGPVEGDLPNLVPTVEKGQTGGAVFRGKASYYESTLEGCIGCKPYYDENGLYFVMRNNERLNDADYTIAIPEEQYEEGYLPFETIVMVTNLDNGKRAVARITDTGGFSRYDRIADLSKALYEELDVKTDESTIEIRVLPTLDRVQ